MENIIPEGFTVWAAGILPGDGRSLEKVRLLKKAVTPESEACRVKDLETRPDIRPLFFDIRLNR